jgi:hypothetical protein
VLRPGAQRFEPEAVQQVVHRLQAPDHAELVCEDALHVLAAQGAHPVGLGRPGAQARHEALFLFVGEWLLAPAPRSIREGFDPAVVVPRDPRAHLALGQEHLLRDLGRGVAQQGQPNGAQSPRDPRPRLGADALGELIGTVMIFDVHGGLLPDTAKLRTQLQTGSQFMGAV